MVAGRIGPLARPEMDLAEARTSPPFRYQAVNQSRARTLKDGMAAAKRFVSDNAVLSDAKARRDRLPKDYQSVNFLDVEIVGRALLRADSCDRIEHAEQTCETCRVWP
jgi:hypothetical protein